MIRRSSAALALAWLGPACFGAEAPRGALDPVSCDALPTAPSDAIDDAEASLAPLSDADLSPGQARLLLQWTDEDGERWLQTEPMDDADLHYDAYGARGAWWPRWAVWTRLPCDPESSAFVWFELQDGTWDPLAPGDYPVSAVVFVVPEREQGGESDIVASGTVTITEAGGGTASGFLAGGGGGALISHFTQEEIGVDFAVLGLAFRDIPADWVLGDER